MHHKGSLQPGMQPGGLHTGTHPGGMQPGMQQEHPQAHTRPTYESITQLSSLISAYQLHSHLVTLHQPPAS